MGSERSTLASRLLVRFLSACLVIAAPLPASAQATKPGGIYRCEINGKRITSDRPIAECSDREQRLLNADGSVRMVIPPSMTADERAEAEARERAEQAERVARQDAIRRDRNLVARFPNEAAHQRAREAALDDVRNAVRISESRVKLLEAEHKKLDEEAEFYPAKPLPQKLKSSIDANEAAQAAQRSLIQNQQAEMVRINANYDAELEHLRQLWSGAPAGSIGAPSGPNSGPPLASGSRSARPQSTGKAIEAAASRSAPR